ncbi:helix-turn-helix domain-containing protein [Streptacidiphilus jiangxiensis]|uniref:Sugar-specific transcriptional regulator TrmB n=1 Tax=Streptacidiphilus jiangxiensis TaxID=235985 RepID=A0A1H7HS63_STRJI|nr:LuxR C-terminal-related transcriptional regulator [Streptacidiphilus jiangxiensis]SEK53008.1 Sugar-specific transcriptional regulator TrmB [Streptacidiphilus jiangxiensis]
MLESVGLDEPTEETYRRLVAHSPATLAELAALLGGIGETRVRRSLETLVALGLAFAEAGRPGRYHAVDPRTGLATLIHAKRLELERTAASVETYAAEYHERMLRSDPLRLVEIVEGPAAIAARVTELLAGAKQEVLAFDAPPYVTPDAAAARDERELLARGVGVRAVYASEVLAIPERAELLRGLVLAGERSRVVPRVPLKMVVVDGRDAVIPLSASSSGTRSLAALVHRSRLCDALVELFEASWLQATPVFSAEARDAHPDIHPDLTEAELTLLHLLHAGLKDEAIARQLGISERTLRRRITDLLTRLGATSRFQAGAQAIRRGWL